MSRLGNDLFHADGCVRANVRTHVFEVYLVANCGHTKVAAGILFVSAETAESARHYVETFLRIPQTHVAEVRLMCHEAATPRGSEPAAHTTGQAPPSRAGSPADRTAVDPR